MRSQIVFLSVTVLLCAPSLSAERTDILKPEFEQLQTELIARKPIAGLRRFFSRDFQKSMELNFSHEGLDGVVNTKAKISAFVEKVEGNKGCLAYAIPYQPETPGNWVELTTYSYQRIKGKWVIVSSFYAVSETYNVVKSNDLCLSLGWPWK